MDLGTLCISNPASKLSHPAREAGGPPSRGSAATAELPEQVLPDGSEDLDRWCHTYGGSAGHAEALQDLHRARPQVAERLARAVTQLPQTGATFEGFRLIDELGRGAFGRVFLARQGDLAGRHVVLKVAAEVLGEAEALAQLQHTNIVPVYSIHRAGSLQAVCMPFLGSTTLADLLIHLRSQERMPHSGMALVSTLANRLHSTRLGSISSTGSSALGGRRIDDTGHGTGGGSQQSSSARLSGILGPSASGPAPDSAASVGRALGRTPPILAMLEGLDYVRSVLWVAARVADGLVHAHDHGIVHRDLKPANILLSDEGQPMLLDFGVAEDTKFGAAAAFIGGTLPYMAPEHLDAVRGGAAAVTIQSDVYALGVIIFELLTGRHPFPGPRTATKMDIARMIADRAGPAPGVRQWNPAASPAVESIVCRCLATDPRHRYQNARELQEDLQRHLQDLPLRYAPEPSLRERGRKWIRRHPRVTSSTTILAASVLVMFGLLGGAYDRSQRLASLEAVQALGEFHEDARQAQLLLNARTDERRHMEEGVVRCRRALDRYQVLSGVDWLAQPIVRHLPAADQHRLREDLSELLLLLARATAVSGAAGDSRAGGPDGGNPTDRIRLALRLNEQAEAVGPHDQVSRAVLTQRAEFLKLLGSGDDAQRVAKQAEATPMRTVRDRYLTATEYAAHGQHRQAIPLLQDAVGDDPQNFWAWFVLGHCHASLAQSADAVASYSAAIALGPQLPWPYFNRGLVYLRQGDCIRAEADLNRAVRLWPGQADPYLNRALARQGLGNFAGAAEDLTRALELDPACTRAYFMRAKARELSGDAAGARADRAEGMKHEPTDEQGWVARGLVRLATDLTGALTDFDRALEYNPRSLAALQNKAHALGRTGRNEEAVRTLDKAVELYPDYVPSRAGRGVYHARLGQREAAVADAREALVRDAGPSNLYQVAGIYALTSRRVPTDRDEAVRLLTKALRNGFGFDLVAIDPDLDPIRAEPEFRRLAEAARSVNGGPK